MRKIAAASPPNALRVPSKPVPAKRETTPLPH